MIISRLWFCPLSFLVLFLARIPPPESPIPMLEVEPVGRGGGTEEREVREDYASRCDFVQ